MTTKMEIERAAKALESFGWALVKYAQKVRAGNVGMAHKWWLICKVRQFRFTMLRKELIVPNGPKNRFFKAGRAPVIDEKVDIFIDWQDNSAPHILYNQSAFLWNGPYVRAWRYAV